MAASLIFRLTGGSSNINPNLSLGGVQSATAVTSTLLNNVFDNVSPVQASTGCTEYRALDIYNAGDATAGNVGFWIGTNTPSTHTAITIGYDSTNSPHSTAATLPSYSSEASLPAGISFSDATYSSLLSIEDIPAGQSARVWLRRVVTANCPNRALDNAVIWAQFA